MRLGNLSKLDEKKLASDKTLTVGIEPESLIDTINILMSESNCDAKYTLGAIMNGLLKITGRIEDVSENRNEGTSKKQ